jgi:hypothetical protein
MTTPTPPKPTRDPQLAALFPGQDVPAVRELDHCYHHLSETIAPAGLALLGERANGAP